MNLDQLLSLVRTLLAAGGPIAGLLAIYGFPGDKAALWLGLASMIIPPIISAVWGIITKTDTAKVIAASNVPGATVSIETAKASAALNAVAQDPKVPNVQPVPPAP